MARETVTLDLLSAGRLSLRVGLGSSRNGEFEPFGEVTDPRERAKLLDQGLAGLTRYWAGSSSRCRCSGRGSRSGSRRSGPTAARCTAPRAGTACSRSGCPAPGRCPELAAEIRALRPPGAPFDFAVDVPPGTDPVPWAAAGATWMLAGLGRQPTYAGVHDAITAVP